MTTNRIKWDIKKKEATETESATKANRDKASEEVKRVWESFSRLCQKAKTMSLSVLLSKLTKIRQRYVDVFDEFNQTPDPLPLQLFDEKIDLIKDLKENPNTFTEPDGQVHMFRTRAEFEAIDHVAKAIKQEGFMFLLFDDANQILAVDTDEAMLCLGKVKRRYGLPYPTVSQFKSEMAMRPEKE